MTTLPICVDDQGVRLPDAVESSCDVLFDGAHVWSFSPSEQGRDHDGHRVVEWPSVMREWLDGTSTVSLVAGGEEIFSEEVTFGDRGQRIRFVDEQGIPVMIDKWGLVQRPFSGRGSGVVEHLVEMAEEILAVLREDCGIEAWIAFGSLLGAARSGKVIGYDSDIDLAYLSHQRTPAAMTREMFEIARALRRRGMRVLNKSGSFITVLFTSPDGGQGSIDLYTTFYVGDLLHETATVRTPVPRSAVEPLGTIELEGRMLPAPADPEVMLTVSYGPQWRTPDPSFRHQPAPDIRQRFDPWFGSLMRYRRNWERLHISEGEPTWGGSEFAAWAEARLPAGRPVIDVGSGPGADTLWFAERGRCTVGLDYARRIFWDAKCRAQALGLPTRFSAMNLYDLRDVLTEAALLARSLPGPRAIYARRLLDVLDRDGVANFWSFAGLLARGGGGVYLEVVEDDGPVAPGFARRRRLLRPEELARDADEAGGRVVEVERAAPVEGAPVWRMAVEWTR